MKKSLLVAVSVLSCSFSMAGSMGPVATNWQFSPYVIGEGAYTWAQNTGIDVNTANGANSSNGWGGRFGGGISRPVAENFKMSFEAGLGYYGSVEKQGSINEFLAQEQFYGFDFLMGGSYLYRQFEIFLKGGVMVENQYYKQTINLNKTTQGTLMTGVIREHALRTGLLPEIKVGGIYNLNDNFGLSLSYMRTFSNVNNSANNYVTVANPGSVELNWNLFDIPPSLNTILFGIQYKFA